MKRRKIFHNTITKKNEKEEKIERKFIERPEKSDVKSSLQSTCFHRFKINLIETRRKKNQPKHICI